LGEGSGKQRRSEEGSSHSGKANSLGGSTKEDRFCAEGEMGEGKGGEEDRLNEGTRSSERSLV
jgi:hypothetical protein